MKKLTRHGDKRMTVREVAEALGVTDETIKWHIRKLYPDLMRNGVTTYLNEAQVTAVKNQIGTGRNDLQNVLQVKNTVTAIDIERMTLQVIEYHRVRIKELEAENKEQQERLARAEPKAEFFDQVADSKDALQMRDVAAALNIPGLGRTKLFALLREKKILDDKNIPYREYQDRGYFRVVEQQWTDTEGETYINLKPLVYQRGIDFIRKVLRQGAFLPS